MLRASEPVEESQLTQIEAVIEKRERRMPLQYALGYGWFLGRRFAVQRGVFIPRTDTESLVEVAKLKIESCGLQNARIGEIGIGSGAISVSLLAIFPGLRIVACDVEKLAIETAAANAREHGGCDRLELLSGNWRDVLPGELDAIVSNPPYIPRADGPTLEPEVAEWEPDVALFGNDLDGMSFYRDIARFGKAHLKDGRGFVVVEVGDGQAASVAAEFASCNWLEPSIYKDVNGLQRVVTASV